jgi:enamine deaminase RidA (YjgF/YER057c/UK114 family)
MKTIINTNNAPAPIGPYSQAVAAMVFICFRPGTIRSCHRRIILTGITR